MVLSTLYSDNIKKGRKRKISTPLIHDLMIRKA